MMTMGWLEYLPRPPVSNGGVSAMPWGRWAYVAMANGLKQTVIGAASSNETLSGTYRDVKSDSMLTILTRPTLDASSASARQYCSYVPFAPKGVEKVLNALHELAAMPSKLGSLSGCMLTLCRPSSD